MGPHYSARRSLRFLPDEAPPCAEDTLRVLAAIHTLDAGDTVRGEVAEGASPEWQAVQARLDLLVTLVSQLSRQISAGARPPQVNLLLSGQRLQWPVAAETEGQGPGVVELYLHEAYPEPLRLYGALDQVRDEQGHTRQEFVLKFDDEDVEDAWQRHIFRHHRRAVARKQQQD